MKNNKKNKTFFALLVEDYIYFTLILVVLLWGLTVAINFQIKRTNKIDYNDSLINGDYSSINVQNDYGLGSYFIILNDKFKIIYQSKKKIEKINFTQDDLDFVNYLNEDNYTDVQKIESSSNKDLTAISIYSFNKKDNKLIVIDKKLRILYSANFMNNNDYLTQVQYNLITNSISIKYNVYRLTFTNQNKQYNMIVYIPKKNKIYFTKKTTELMIATSVGFLGLYTLLIVLFVIRLNYTLKKPLGLLTDAMSNFGADKKKISYSGPREFVDICNDFNEMVDRLNKSEEEKQKLSEEKQKIIADMSHDLKTPITVIQGYLKAIKDGVVKKEEAKDYLEIIYQKSSILVDMINTLYEYNKIEHPDYNLKLEKTDVCVFLRNYMADKYNDVIIAGFNMEVDIPEKHIFSMIDQAELKRAFDNIITNSIKHNKKKTTIFCTLKIINDKIKIVFADNGIGISKDIIDNIFEPFVVGEKSRNKQGSGLGLSITKKILDLHEAKIYVNKESKYKTEFDIILNKID